MGDIDHIALRVDEMQVLTPEQACHYRIIHKSKANGNLIFYIDQNSFHATVVDELEMIFGNAVLLEKTSSEIISKSLSKYYRVEHTTNIVKAVKGNYDDFL